MRIFHLNELSRECALSIAPRIENQYNFHCRFYGISFITVPFINVLFLAIGR